MSQEVLITLIIALVGSAALNTVVQHVLGRSGNSAKTDKMIRQLTKVLNRNAKVLVVTVDVVSLLLKKQNGDHMNGELTDALGRIESLKNERWASGMFAEEKET